MTTGNKRYPTRTHEVLGVEVDEEFEIIDYPGVTFLVPENGWMYVKWPSGKKIAGQDYWASAINHGITRRPRLTQEQIKELKALLVFDKKWLVKEVESLGAVMAFSEKPTREEDGGWWSDEIENNFVMTLPLGAAVNGLVSSSDNAPLDIVATLKAAGVEVEK